MKAEYVAYYLNRGTVLGLQLSGNDTANGNKKWMLLRKQKPADRFFERFAESTDAAILQEQTRKWDTPYVIIVQEVSKEVFDKGEIKSQGDYLLYEVYYFNTLEEADQFLAGIDHCLDEFTWLTDIEAIV